MSPDPSAAVHGLIAPAHRSAPAPSFTVADYHRLAETGILLARRPSPGHYPAVRDEARWWFNTAEGDLSAARVSA